MNCGPQFRDRHTVDHKFFLRRCLGYVPLASGSRLGSAVTPKLKLSLSWLVRASAVACRNMPALARLHDAGTHLRTEKRMSGAINLTPPTRFSLQLVSTEP